ncbi:hypothetical protein KHA90_24215 [Flavobacterium psychroterrae]|uniref:Uncharacterized protein n=1 Tax=Flavobacterium psychroterrae TaxID=2133767 RepID=A0ABS5PK37_9FLAO|nr:hypothetical protein [Flavobacterium psychroterrae]MBS7234113.1 hypothetical protein [Flavobacterium psychroterrae]
MLTTNEFAKVFDTILSTPGMNEVVKMDLKISRKNVLLLSHIMERGLAKTDDKTSPLLAGITQENLEELKALGDEFLTKSGLTELNKKLTTLSESGKS